MHPCNRPAASLTCRKLLFSHRLSGHPCLSAFGPFADRGPPLAALPRLRLFMPAPSFMSGGELPSSAASMSDLVLRAKNALADTWLVAIRALGEASLLHQEAMATSSPHTHMQHPMLCFAPTVPVRLALLDFLLPGTVRSHRSASGCLTRLAGHSHE